MEKEPGMKKTPAEFSQETKEALKSLGYEIIILKEESLDSLREKGANFYSNWHKDWEFEKQTSRPFEVAIKPRSPLLLNSSNKNFFRQERQVKEFSSKISKQIPEVEAAIGEASDYAQIILYYVKHSGKDIFKGNFIITKTRTEKNEYAGIVYDREDGLGVISMNRLRAKPGIHAAPIIRRKVA